MNPTSDFQDAVLRAIRFRASFLSAEPHDSAFRLLNGFTEHLPGLVIDILAKTAVIHDYTESGDYAAAPDPLKEILLQKIPWLKAIVLKERAARSPETRNGMLIHGVKPDSRIVEHGIRYAVDLMLNRDSSFYADTRNLRAYLKKNMAGKTVLNTFAYTGSLGVAAAAGGAEFVLQTDLSDRFLEIGRKSCTLNTLYFNKKNFVPGNFFAVVSRLKKENRLFDCVIVDPPFFSRTSAGTVDLAADPVQVINKARPLVADGGTLIVVNNSLYLSGAEFLEKIDSICDGTYVSRGEIIPIPEDFTGSDPDYLSSYQISPAPFNHPTKIVLLQIHRKTLSPA